MRPSSKSRRAAATQPEVVETRDRSSSTAAGVSRRSPRHLRSSAQAASGSMPEMSLRRKSTSPVGGHQSMSPRRGTSPHGPCSGSGQSSSARRATPSANSRKQRPAPVKRTGTVSCADTRAPRAASLGPSSRHVRRTSDVHTTTRLAPSIARALTSRATSSASAKGPAGSSMRTAPPAATGSASGQNSLSRSTSSSGARDEAAAPSAASSAASHSDWASPWAERSRIATPSAPAKAFARARALSPAGPAAASDANATDQPVRARPHANRRWERGISSKPARTTEHAGPPAAWMRPGRSRMATQGSTRERSSSVAW